MNCDPEFLYYPGSWRTVLQSSCTIQEVGELCSRVPVLSRKLENCAPEFLYYSGSWRTVLQSSCTIQEVGELRSSVPVLSRKLENCDPEFLYYSGSWRTAIQSSSAVQYAAGLWPSILAFYTVLVPGMLSDPIGGHWKLLGPSFSQQKGAGCYASCSLLNAL